MLFAIVNGRERRLTVEDLRQAFLAVMERKRIREEVLARELEIRRIQDTHVRPYRQQLPGNRVLTSDIVMG